MKTFTQFLKESENLDPSDKSLLDKFMMSKNNKDFFQIVVGVKDPMGNKLKFILTFKYIYTADHYITLSNDLMSTSGRNALSNLQNKPINFINTLGDGDETLFETDEEFIQKIVKPYFKKSSKEINKALAETFVDDTEFTAELMKWFKTGVYSIDSINFKIL